MGPKRTPGAFVPLPPGAGITPKGYVYCGHREEGWGALSPHRTAGGRPAHHVSHNHHPLNIPRDMATNTCTCVSKAGDSFYCDVHGGNDSWAALLSAAARSLQHVYDPKIARKVRAARNALPPDHALGERVDEILEQEKLIEN